MASEVKSLRPASKNHPEVVSQSDVLGYGPELADALARYHLATSVEDHEYRKQSLKNFASWMELSPHPKNLSFADIYFTPTPETQATTSLSLIITPKRNGDDLLQGHNEYLRALRDFWGEKQEHAFGPHRAFSKGLTIYFGDKRRIIPATQVEVEAHDRDYKNKFTYSSNPFWPIRETGLFLDDLDRDKPMGSNSGGLKSKTDSTETDTEHRALYGVGTKKFLVASDAGRVFQSQTDQYDFFQTHVSETNIFSLWQQWKNAFRKHRNTLVSSDGKDLRWLVAMPIGYRQAKYPHDFSGFTQSLSLASTKPWIKKSCRVCTLHPASSFRIK